MSEPITYRIAIDFTTNRPLTLSELVDLGGQAWTQIHEPSEEQENEDDPYDTVDPVLRLWVGDSEVAGLDPKPVFHAHVAWYEYWEDGNWSNQKIDMDDTGWHCFAHESEAEELAEEWLAPDAWPEGSRANVGVRMIVVPEWDKDYLESSDPIDSELESKWHEWSCKEVWNEERRVGERMRVWLAS